MKSGMYIAELVKRLFAGTRQHYETDADCVRHILENQVYGLSPTGILHGITNAYIFGFDDTHEISTKNFAQHDLLPEAKDGTVAEKLQQLFERGENMKFDAVVGNPPYQVGTDTNFATPVYNLFIDAAVELKPEVSLLIHPARFLFNAGATPKDWNQKMLNDPHFNVIKYEADSQKIFGSVDIKGGVAITMWNKNQTEGGIGGTFVPFEELRSILNKVKVGGFDEIVGARGETKTTHPLDSKYPNDLRIAPNYFERYPDVFVKSKDEKHTIKIIGLEKGNKRTERYIDKSIVKDPKLEKWKVFIPKSNGSGALGEVVSTPLTGCTYSFLQVGAFESRYEADNCLKYIKTRFCRVMLGTLKVTQDNPKSTWRNVPLQDFTSQSDIDWSKSIPEIDQQLYAKYGLDKNEIDFIETRVRAME